MKFKFFGASKHNHFNRLFLKIFFVRNNQFQYFLLIKKKYFINQKAFKLYHKQFIQIGTQKKNFIYFGFFFFFFYL